MKLVSKTSCSLLAFLVALVVYAVTAAPGLLFTDSGELAAVCATLGVAHPTGYPLFTIIGHLWTLIPLPLAPIAKLNLLAAVLTAGSVLVFFHLVHLFLTTFAESLGSSGREPAKPSRGRAACDPVGSEPGLPGKRRDLFLLALAAALIYAFALTIWAQGTAIEVHSLQLLLINGTLFLFLRAAAAPQLSFRPFGAAALLLGLAFANHLTTVLIVPALILLFIKPPGRPAVLNMAKIRLALLLVIPFLLGLGFYLYLPLSSMSAPDFDWGGVDRSLEKFLNHVQGKQYHVWMFSDPDAMRDNFNRFLEVLPQQLAWIGLAPLLVGLIATSRASKDLFWFVILLIGACLAYTLNYSIHDIETYFVTAFIGLFLFTAAGLLALSARRRWIVPAAFSIPLLLLVFNFEHNDLSDHEIVPEFTHVLVDHLEPQAIVISAQWDYWCSAFWYEQQVEGYREDVVLIEKELLRRTWYPRQLERWYPEVYERSRPEMEAYLVDLERFESGAPYESASIQGRFVALLNSFIDKNYDERPIYITSDILKTEKDVARDYDKIPEGFAFRLRREETVHPVTVEGLGLNQLLTPAEGPQGHLEQGIRFVASQNITNIGRYAMATNQKETAIAAFRLALRVDPGNRRAAQGLRQLTR